MPHPLDGAVARLTRADRHFDELKASIDQFRSSVAQQYISTEYHPGSKEVLIHFTNPPATFDAKTEWPPIISDIIHQLRSTLDNLVFELAKHDASGVAQDGTQFLIEDDEVILSDKGKEIGGFRVRARRYLKPLTPNHVAAIEQLQPYKGVTWTKTLRDISNPDKHKTLQVVGNLWHGSGSLTGGLPGSFEGRPGLIFPGAGEDGCDLYMENDTAMSVLFEEWMIPVIETLDVLKREVRATVDAFKPEF